MPSEMISQVPPFPRRIMLHILTQIPTRVLALPLLPNDFLLTTSPQAETRSFLVRLEFALLFGTSLLMTPVVLLVTVIQAFWTILTFFLAPEYISQV